MLDDEKCTASAFYKGCEEYITLRIHLLVMCSRLKDESWWIVFHKGPWWSSSV